jgi:hypothetical protein
MMPMPQWPLSAPAVLASACADRAMMRSAYGRRASPARVGVEQLLAHRALQAAQLLADPGLGVTERGGGAADAAGADGGDEGPQQHDVQIRGHKHSL